MKRKLIKQEAFDKIASESVTAAERELVEAEPILAKALGRDELSFHCCTESTVVYKADNAFVHAGYEVKNESVTFNNIEELVIDETSRKEKKRSIIAEMLDAIVLDKKEKAEQLFSNYLSMVKFNEGKKPFPFKKKNEKDGKVEKKEKKNFFSKKAEVAGKDLKEAYETTHNVLEYVEFMKVGPAIAEAVSKRDEKGNVTHLRIPSLQQRNESRLHRFDWKTLNAKAADSRKKIPYFAESQDFCKAIAHLHRQNAFSNKESLVECLNAIVQQWPDLLYATQGELAQVIGEALQMAGVNSFGDTTCEQMAEGILRTACEAYKERVAQILHLASAPKMEENSDPYAYFQKVVEGFFPSLDEKFGLERKVFSDLYEAARAVYHKADRQGDRTLCSESASYINELASILNGEEKPNIQVAENTANWLRNIIETNLEMGTWVVSNTPHLTVNGDHPDMVKKASQGYSPSKDFSGNWGDEAPAIGQDDMNYKSGKHAKKMRNDSWGQVGDEVFPKLKNPYVPKPFGDYTMKGEKGVDKSNSDHSLWSSDDTWPNLKNPYVPKEDGGEGGKGYKMKNGKDTDLVVDR